ncbi:MAG: hypothetical protein A2284_05725 [Deltaproteobacteria bacterium RIFOXYA12_FULL_61_11]|nr:MAG: hypothetical protein A2284_05725 [Deltaproteobacteria bacterium RIFOXYA12_FULL_61_11]
MNDPMNTTFPCKKVLLVDDDDIITTIFRIFAKKQVPDLELLTTNDSSKAFELLREFRPDLLLIDLFMPNLDGMSLVRALRSDPELSTLPVIFFTAAYRDPQLRTMLKDPQVLGVIGKPFSPKEVFAQIAELYREYLKRSVEAEVKEVG